MADPHPRYVVREISGWPMGGGPKTSTSVWVSDRWYCAVEIASYPSSKGCDGISVRRQSAERLCAELNAAHDAWLAAG